MVAEATVALTTAVCGPPRPAPRAPPAAAVEASVRDVAASAKSMPQRARISGAPGKKRTQAAAATRRRTRAKAICFQAAIGTPGVPHNNVFGAARAFSEGVTARILDAKQRKISNAPLCRVA